MKTILVSLLFLAFSEIIQAQTWSAVGSGTDDRVFAFAVYNGEIYVGGRFTIAGGITANHIAKWNGTTWSVVGSGTDGGIFVLAVYNNELYAGGAFTMAGGVSANNIAKWDGSTWSSVSSGIDGDDVSALKVYNSDLYVGGWFSTAGGITVNNIAKWNGTTWAAVGSGTNEYPVGALEVFNGELYAGGHFTLAGGVSVNNIARWNGTSWSDVGSGTNSEIRTLLVHDNELFAGGFFLVAGGISVHRIAKWDGTSWADVGLGFNFPVNELCEYNSELYATGGFTTTISGITVNHIAKWDGTSWSALGSGLDLSGETLCVYNDGLYVGGDFITTPANYIAKWSSGCGVPPQPGTITGNTAVCQGSSQTYSIAAVSGATSYTWTLPNGGGWTGSSTTTSITATVGSGGGDISVTADNTCGSSTPQTLAVTVNSTPAQPGTISGSSSVCEGSSQTYSITPVNGATFYSWTLPSGGGWTGSSTTNSITVTVGTNSGNISVTANNTCGNSPAQSKAITVISTPAQPQDISGNITVCQGSSQMYFISTVSGATSYTWSLPDGWSGSSTSSSITTIAGASSGTISVTANNTCGNSIEQTLFVTVNSVPAQPGPISGNIMVCQGSAQTYTINAVSGATSYNWAFPSGWTGSSTSNSIDLTVGSNSGNISVTANNSCGSSAAQTLAVIVMTTPSQPGPISGSNTVCQNSSQTYSISSVSGATSYLWTIPNGWTGISSTNSITVSTGSNGGSVSVSAINSCDSSAAQSLSVTVNAIPVQPDTISGSNAVCNGTTQAYIVSEVPGATSYTWTLPSGWTGTSTTTSISATVGSSSGNISVTANNSCGSSPAQTFAVTVNSIPTQPDTISGNIAVCEGGVEVYSINAVSGATSYLWIVPPGWTGTSSSDSMIATIGSTAGNISVIATNLCGSSNAQTLAVTVNTVPPQPGFITGSNSVCQGSVQTYSISSVNNANDYTWTIPPGWSGVSDSTSITATVGASAGIISVTANNNCGSSIPQTLIIDNSAPAQPGSISGSESVCEGTSQTYSISPIAGAISYTWTLPDGWTGSSNTTSITAITGDTSGNISVTSNNICGSSTPQTFPVTVILIPLQPNTIIGNTTVNVGQELTYSINDVSGATGYNWSLSGGGNITSGQNTTSVTVNWQAAGNDTLFVNATNECGTGMDQTLPITVSMVSALIELGDPFGIKIMPNPFEGEVYLTATGVMNKIMDIEILNLSGQTIFRSQVKAVTNDYTQRLILGDVPAGLYEVKILIGKKLFVRTISRLD